MYKKKNEQTFWGDKANYESIAREYIDELHKRDTDGKLRQSLENLAEYDDYRLICE